MKTMISIIGTFCIIVCINLQALCQEEKFHQITFGNVNSNIEKHVYGFGQEKILKNTFQNFDNVLEIQADFKMDYIWIYNDSGFEFFDYIDSNFVELEIPTGNYNIITGFAPGEYHNLLIVKENLVVNNSISLEMSKEDADYTFVYNLKREDGSNLRINTINFYLSIKNIPALTRPGLHIMHARIDSEVFTFQIDTLPDHFTSEWSVKGKEGANNGNLYLLNDSLNFFNFDTVVSNGPTDYAYADFNYYLPDSIIREGEKQLFTYIPSTHVWSAQDEKKYYPIQQRVYQDISPNISLITSKFSQSLNADAVGDPYNFLYTQDIRLGKNKIFGYHWNDQQSDSFIISEMKNVHIGLTPTYWFGKFMNEKDTIKVRTPNRKWDYLFLSQSNDVLRHYPIEYKIYQNGVIIKNDYFDLLWGPHMLRFGFDRNDMTIPVEEKQYEIVIVDNYNEVASHPGTSMVKAVFDLRESDKNPPNITLFQILSDNELANILIPNKENKIRFKIEDDIQIDSIELCYSALTDSNYIRLPIMLIEPYWETNIPELQNGYYSIKLKVLDSSGNYINTNIKPAFYYGDISFIERTENRQKSDEFLLYQNYPNPFNATTTISFTVPWRFKESLEISIYNILGEKVKLYKINPYSRNAFNIKWDGKDSFGLDLPSGIYIIKLKGGDVSICKKVVLLK